MERSGTMRVWVRVRTSSDLDPLMTAEAGPRTLWVGWIAVAMILLVVTTGGFAATRWETLEAIHYVENPQNSSRAGRYGELGAYQFRPETWRMHSTRPFNEALDRKSSDEVAVRHYEWIKAGLVRAGIEPTTYNIALAWNAGVASVVNAHVPAASRSYATRVDNIATQLNSRIAANSP
jgi:hypothetical protein